jgi:hypothetical protein
MTTNVSTCAECGTKILVELDRGVPLGDGLCQTCADDEQGELHRLLLWRKLTEAGESAIFPAD